MVQRFTCDTYPPQLPLSGPHFAEPTCFYRPMRVNYPLVLGITISSIDCINIYLTSIIQKKNIHVNRLFKRFIEFFKKNHLFSIEIWDISSI